MFNTGLDAGQTVFHVHAHVMTGEKLDAVSYTHLFVKTGGPELADELEENGYDQYLPEGADSESALA